jgi:hypothetical protein
MTRVTASPEALYSKPRRCAKSRRDVTDPAIGISRNDMLKALGNGVVPQQAAAATAMWLRDVTSERVA